MKSYQFDKRIVLTLDAGGTNFVFSAMQSNQEIVEPIRLKSNADNLEKCLAGLVDGFTAVLGKLNEKPVAISFAFPGPADYPRGIISDDLPNFPAFKGQGGVAIGPFLHQKFGLPVFINNDGDLFAYGEALAGVLPEVNKKLEQAGSIKRYNNLLGVTFGTGFGAGIVANNQLLLGDNSCGGEIFANRNLKYPGYIVEESVSIRGVKRVYNRLSGNTDTSLEPRDIFHIAEGTREGDQNAAKMAFAEMGEVAGDTIANVITMIDGLIVIGGGLAAAHKYYLPAMLKHLNGSILMMNGGKLTRIPQKVYNLEDDAEFAKFAKGVITKVKVPGSAKIINYDSERRIGVAVSKIGASKAIMLGAYAYALFQLDCNSGEE